MREITKLWEGPVCKECKGSVKPFEGTSLFKCEMCSAIYQAKELSSLIIRITADPEDSFMTSKSIEAIRLTG